MDDVAEEAELSKGTLYLYFKSKEDLYLAITLRGIHIMMSMFEKAVQNQKTGLDKTFAIGKAFFDFANQYPDYFNALSYFELNELSFDHDSSPANACMHEGHDSLDILINVLKEGIADGSIRPDINPLRMATILWGMSSGIIQLVALKGNHLEKEHGVHIGGLIDDSFSIFRCALENKKH